jgi:hypothetical protein
LLNFMTKGPSAVRALPSWEHFAPVLVSLGAALAGKDSTVTFPITGFRGNYSRRSVQFG